MITCNQLKSQAKTFLAVMGLPVDEFAQTLSFLAALSFVVKIKNPV
jgi:hypothetical protein